MPDAIGRMPPVFFQPRFTDELAKGEPEGNPCALGLDVDEAAHAGFALMKNGGVGTFRQHAHHQLSLAAHHHVARALACEPLARGGVGLGGVLAGTALVGPAAGFALHAGWHEWRESAQLAKKFAERKQHLLDEAKRTQSLSSTSRKHLGRLTASFDNALTGRIADNATFAKASAYSGLIGKYSCLSGAAILARIAVEVVRNLGGAAAVGTTHVAKAAANGTLSPSFLLSTGLTSQALAIFASGCAVMLGVNFVRKTDAALKIWQSDAPYILSKRSLLKNPVSAYGLFLEAKSRHRLDFIKNFHWKNKMFLAGSGLYALGTLLPSCIKMLAAVGVLSSKKVGTQIILALFAAGLSGAVIMGLFSHQFFYGHPNVERYEQYAFKDTKEIDRLFLTNIDTFIFTDKHGKELGTDYAARQGVAMREAAFNAIHKREKIREAFLQHVAASMHRTYRHLAHVGDADYNVQRPFITKIKTMLDPDRLRSKDIAQWLQSRDNKRHLLQTFGDMLAETQSFLAQKENVHKRMHDRILEGAKRRNDMQQQGEYGEAMFGSYNDTVALHKAHRDLMHRIVTAESHADVVEGLNAVLALQARDDAESDEHASLEQKLADHMLKHLAARYNHDRGILLDIESRAGKRHTRMLRIL